MKTTVMSSVRYRTRIGLCAALAACFLAAGPAAAEDELYKWVDEDGNVTYQDRPPPDERGQVKTMDQDLGGAEPAPVMPDVDVVLYSIEACDPCDLVRELLRERGVPFEEKNADNDAEVQAEIKEVAGSVQVPVLAIGNEALTGYNKDLIINELEEAGFGAGAAAEAGGGSSGGSEQLSREQLEQMSPDERQQAAQDAALRGEDNDLFDEDEGFMVNEDIFADTDDGQAPDAADDITEYEEIPEDERIRISE